MKNLSEEERDNLENIISDLKVIFDKNRVNPGELGEIQDNLEGKEVKNYLRDLREGSKPETALREELLAGNSTLANYIFGKKEPEVSTTKGFVDYKARVSNVPILVELKPLFTPVFREESGQTVLKYLKEDSLDWKDHQEQIEKYLRENEFLILTNLKHWYFFSKRAKEPIKADPITFEKFNEDFKRIENLKDFLERFEESQTIRGDLDKHFFNNLDNWVSSLDSVKYKAEVTEEQKIEAIINLINKFIFIQTLDDHFVVDFHWIRKRWEEKESKWQQMGKKKVLSKFLGEINEWFYEHYDTELFETENGSTILQLLADKESNIQSFYEKLKRVLGLEHWQRAVSVKGITNYNYRQIDEDIFGKAYETYLAEVRKEQGIFYTPKFVTQHIVEETVGKKFDKYLKQVENAIKDRDSEKARNNLKKLTNLKVLDPACGSGSFLIKAVRAIWKRYTELIDKLKTMNTEISQGNQTLELSEENQKLRKIIKEMYKILGYRPQVGKGKRVLMSKLILRHIYGNDLDAKALSVAKVNIWLSAIKLIPKDYRYERIKGGSGYSLPDLEINLGHGDALVGLSDEKTVAYLDKNYEDEVQQLTNLREEYIGNPTNEKGINRIKELLEKIRKKLDDRFEDFIDNSDRPAEVYEDTIPFYWPLTFWHVFYNEGKFEPKSGFDIVIGNPPYYNEVREHKEDFHIFKNSPTISDYYQSKMDVFYFFIERALDLTTEGSFVGYIILEYWNTRTHAKKLNKKIAHESKILNLVNFHDFPVFERSNVGIHNDTLIMEKRGQNNEPYEGYKVNVIEVLDGDVPRDEVRDALLKGQFSDNIIQHEKKVSFNQDTGRLNFLERDLDDVISKIESKADSTIDGDNITTGVNVYIDKVTRSILNDLEEDNIKHNFKEGEGVFVLSKNELNSLGLNSREKELIKPFYVPHQVEQFFVEPEPSGYLIYTQSNYIDYDGRDIYRRARKLAKKDDKDWSDLSEKEKEEYKEEIRKKISKEIKKKYPNITNHLDRYLDPEVITSDRKPYGIHRSRDEKFFERPNRIVSVRKTFKPNFAHVKDNCYMDEGVNVIKSEEDPDSLIAVLNSPLMHFWLRFGFAKKHGDQLQIDKEVLKEAPIKLPKEGNLNTKSETLRGLKKIKFTRRKIWEKTSQKLKSDVVTLTELLTQDRRYRQRGRGNKSWFSNVPFYPEQREKVLEDSYAEFEVQMEVDKSKIVIYGISEEASERVFSLELDSRQLMKVVYFSIEDLFRSGKRVNNLKDLLDKVEIPIIKPNIKKNTPNILTEVEKRFKDWLEKQEFEEDLPENILKIENKIQEIKTNIDTRVFDLYDLERSQVVTVLDSLKIRENVKNNILTRFDELS